MPVAPIFVLDLVPEERQHLLDLLASLTPGDWRRPTVCDGWSVQDLAAHIVGDDFGVLAHARDAYSGGWLDTPSWDELVAQINGQNAAWVRAMRRLSPRNICDLLWMTGEQYYEHACTLDPHATGVPVSWAGPDPAPVWLDMAREYTERWAHQQQIRDAVARPGLKDRRFFAPVLDAYVRALPHTFRTTAAPEATHIRLTITGEAGAAWSLVRGDGAWQLHTAEAVASTADIAAETGIAAAVELDQETAWRLFTKTITPEQARPHATLRGDAKLCARVLEMVSIIA